MAKDYVDEMADAFSRKYASAYSLNDLYTIRERLIRQNADTSIIDNAISIKIKSKKDKEQEEIEFKKKLKKIRRHAFLSGLFGGLSSGRNMNNDLSSWEKQEMINNELEEHNFEEEIEDEDDFYSDDLD